MEYDYVPPPDGPPGSPPPPPGPPPGSPYPQYPGGPYPPLPPAQGADGKAVASMVLGIVAAALCCLPLVGPICGAIAIVYYAKFTGAFNASGGRLKGKGMSIAGLVCGIVGCVVGLIYTVY